MEHSPTDRDLLQQYITSGDRASLDRLVRRYVHLVYATARRELGDAHAADDVTQAVFIVLTRKAASVPPGRIGGWLFQTTRYAAASARKVAARRMRHERVAAMQRRESDMSQQLTASEDERPLLPLLNGALASLGAADREAVILRYLRGEDFPAVAASLQISEPAARKRIARAVEKLRKTFAARGVSSAGSAAVLNAVTFAGSEQAPAATVAGVSAAIANASAASAGAVGLSMGVGKMMLWVKLKIVAGVVIATLLAGGVGVELVLHASTKTIPAQAATQPVPIAGVLADGTTVELLAVSYNPADGDGWWAANGSSRRMPEWVPQEQFDSEATPADNPPNDRQLIFRIRPPVVNGPPANAPPELGGLEGGRFAAALGEGPEGYFASLVRFEPDSGSDTVRVRVAAGPFTTGSKPGQEYGPSGSTPYGDYLMSDFFERNGLAAVIISHTFYDGQFRIRVRADDAANRWVYGRIVEGQSIGRLAVETYVFDGVTLATARRSGPVLEVRPVRWVEFRNVSLRPGQKTDVQVVTSDNRPSTGEAPVPQ